MNALYSAFPQARGPVFRGVTGTADAHLPPPVQLEETAASYKNRPEEIGRAHV